MSYLSLRFLCFVAVSLVLFYALPKKCRPAVLLAASLFFYVLCSRFLVIPVICLATILYGGALWMGKQDEQFNAAKKELSKEERKARKQTIKTKKKRILALECSVAFGMLVAFKYLGFLTGIANDILAVFTDVSLSVPQLLLPLGISYYTLSMVGYAADVYHGQIKPEKNFVKLLTFSVYFPQIVEGPIASYKKFSAQLDANDSLTFDRFMKAVERILLGLLKKMIVADRAAMVANIVFDSPDCYHSLASASAMVMYAVNIYFDFSGCIDIVSGVSELFGIELAQNFRRPFFSRSVQEFWRRWHMSLGNWIKNYIFYPLSLSKMNQKLSASKKLSRNKHLHTTLQMLLPLFFVWLFTGIWHGASWKYVLYGLYYYIILAFGLLLEPAFQKLCDKLHICRDSKSYHAFQTVRTIVLVLVGLTLFRADTTAVAVQIVASLFHLGGMLADVAALYNACELSALDYAVIFVGVLIHVILSCKEEYRDFDIYEKLQQRPVLRWLFCTVAIVLLIALGVYGAAYTAQPFVYAQF